MARGSNGASLPQLKSDLDDFLNNNLLLSKLLTYGEKQRKYIALRALGFSQRHISAIYGLKTLSRSSYIVPFQKHIDEHGYLPLFKLKQQAEITEFSNFFVTIQEKLTAFVTRKVADPPVIDKICGNVFIRCFRKIERGEIIINRLAFVRTVAENLIKDYYRSPNSQVDTDDLNEEAIDSNRSQENSWLNSIVVTEAVNYLPNELKDLIRMKYFEGLSLAQILERTGLEAGVVNYRLRRAFKILKTKIPSDYKLEP